MTRTAATGKRVTIQSHKGGASLSRQRQPQMQSRVQPGSIPLSALNDWLASREVLTSEDELSGFIASFHSSKYNSLNGNGLQGLTYRDFLEYIVLPTKKEKLREKVLKRCGLKASQSLKPKKKKDAEVMSTSGVSAVSKDTANSVERRKEEEAAKITVDFAMAQIFE